jgi:hypothetical protein
MRSSLRVGRAALLVSKKRSNILSNELSVERDSSLGGGEADWTRPRAVLERRDIIRWRRYETRHNNPWAA